MPTEDKKQIRRQIVEKGVKQLLDEAKVPARLHLKVVQALQQHVENGTKDRGAWLVFFKKHAEQMQAHEIQNKKAEETLHSYGQEVERVKKITKGEKGDSVKGDKGEPGDTPEIDHESIVKTVLARIPMPKTSEGQPLDVKGLVSEVLKSLTDPKNPILSTVHLKDINPFTQRLQSAINQNSQGFNFNGKRIKFEELMHGGAQKSTPGSFGIINVTGTVNDSNTSFTAATLPTLLNINGAFYQQTGGAITWSYSGTTITLSSPVGTGGQIYGIA